MNSPKNIAVFASGNGTNAENLIRYFQQFPDRGRVSLIITNRLHAGVIERAGRLGVECIVLSRDQFSEPEVILPLLRSHDIGLIVLAGFLLMIPAFLIDAYPKRIINIHPSLLPKFGGKGMYGARVHEAVVTAGEKQSGVTIHYVSPGCDEGEHIFSASVELTSEDTPSSVEAKIHKLEQKFFPPVVARILKQ